MWREGQEPRTERLDRIIVFLWIIKAVKVVGWGRGLGTGFGCWHLITVCSVWLLANVCLSLTVRSTYFLCSLNANLINTQNSEGIRKLEVAYVGCGQAGVYCSSMIITVENVLKIWIYEYESMDPESVT